MKNGPRLTIVPIGWRAAAAFIEENHRHLDAPRGFKFTIGVIDESGKTRGVAVCGRPISRVLDDGLTLEVNRTATDGCQNANSALYGACWRVAAAMGYRRMVTYTQGDETGASLKAANYRRVRDIPARGSWADASQKLKHIRNPVGNGGIQRTLWEQVNRQT